MHLGLPSCQTFTAPTPLNPTSICHLIYSFSGQDRAVVVNYADGSLLCVGFNGIFRRYTGYTEHTRTIPKIHGQYRTHDYTENTRAIPNTHELYRTRDQMLSVIVYCGLRNRQVFPFPTTLLNPTPHYYLPTSTKGRFFLR